MRAWLALALGLVLVLGGGFVARHVRTAGGVARRAAAGRDLTVRGLLHVPAGATPGRPAPAVLAVHGFANTREMQDPFAIELARRGFVVLAIDMPGHGASDGIVGAAGFGGPAALRYLRALPFVARDAIGLEGHSLGGAAVMAAAVAAPDGYRAMALVGSSPKFAARPIAPRNMALVLGRYEEFAPLSWKVARGDAIPRSVPLRRYVGTAAPVAPGRIYGDIAAGTARRLTLVSANHPLEHLSPAAVAAVVDWFGRTLPGARPVRPVAGQIWPLKEVATLAALAGALLAMAATAMLALRLHWFRALRPVASEPVRGRRRWLLLAATSGVPALLYVPAMFAAQRFEPGALFPQWVQNQLAAWALAGSLLATLVAVPLRQPASVPARAWGRSLALAGVVVVAGYALLLLSEAVYGTDFRFWIWALRPLDGDRLLIALGYAPLWFAAFLPMSRAVATLAGGAGNASRAALTGAVATAGGMTVLTVVEYGMMVAFHRLATPGAPLVSILAIQLAPVLAAAGAALALAARRTGSIVPGAAVCALLVAWYVTGGTATHWTPAQPVPVLPFAAAR